MKGFVRTITTKFAVSGADNLILPQKELRTTAPTPRKKRVKGGEIKFESRKQHIKRIKVFRCHDKNILYALQEMANTNKHFLARELSTFTSGVVAWDFICSQLKGVIYKNKMVSGCRLAGYGTPFTRSNWIKPPTPPDTS